VATRGAAGALLYLARAQAANRWRTRLRRLRQPRYLLGALAALAYFGWIAWGAGTGRGSTRPAALVVWAIPLIVAATWIGRPNPLALAFSQAEVDFLFAAPVTRRTLLHARLLGQQAAALGAILVWVVLFDPAREPATAVVRGVGVWIFVTAISLHRTGATLARIEIPDAPRRPPIARIIAYAWLCAVAGAFVHAWRAAGRLEVFWAGPIVALADRLAAMAATPAVRLVLTPVRWLTGPTLATTAVDALAALPGALLVLAALYLWVVRDPRPFEEAAVDATRRFADRIAAARRGAWRAPVAAAARPTTTRIPLPRRGPAALAFVWKTGVATARAHSAVTLLAIAIALAAGAIALPRLWPDADDGTALRTALLAAFFVAAFVALPGWFRQDLRAELGHLVFLKTAPIPSRDIVAAQTGAAAAVAWFGLVVLFGVPIAVVVAEDPLLGFGTTLALLGEALVVALPVLVLLHVTVHNALAILLPGWTRIGQAGVGGLQAMGQTYVTAAAILVTLAVLLVVPGAAGAACIALVRGAPGIALAIVAGAVVALGEWWLACRWLGRQLDRIEPESLPATR
jgi:hypothetical protein